MLKPKWHQKQPTLPLYYKDKKVGKHTNIPALIGNWLSHSKKTILKGAVVGFIIYGLLFLYSLIPEPETVLKPQTKWERRKMEVRQAFLDSWHDYARHGWGNDIYQPVSQRGRDMGPSPLGWIIVDSLDTLQLMECKEEYEDAKSWVKYELNYDDHDSDVNTFETTIRMLGGLLSAYYLTEDELYLERATDLGNKLSAAFNSPTGIPYSSVNLHSGAVKGSRDGATTAEATTLQLEFKYLAKLTGEKLFWDLSEKAMQAVDKNRPEGGLVPIFIDPETGKYKTKLVRLGSRGDSYYEYLLKQYLQTGEKIYLDMYEESYMGIRKYLVAKSYPNHLTFIGERPNGLDMPLDSKMDHLVCFTGGLFALGATEGKPADSQLQSSWDSFHSSQMILGREIAKTCYHMYHDVPATGLSPEIVVFNTQESGTEDFIIRAADRHNLQRPETVETLYYLYKITGDEKYREWGYEIFENFIKYARVPEGKGKDDRIRYTCLRDVTVNPPVLKDNMESFWLAETLKYLYLLFADEVDSKWDLQHIVFNTEAHPLPRFSLKGTGFSTGWKRLTREEIAQEAKEKQVPAEGAEKVRKVEENIEKAEMHAKQEAPKGESDEDRENIEENVEKNKKVVEKMKSHNEIPEAKHQIAQPLDEQVREANQIAAEIPEEAV